MAGAADEQAKQTLRTFEGMGERMTQVLDELPEEQREEWRERFHAEAERIVEKTVPIGS